MQIFEKLLETIEYNSSNTHNDTKVYEEFLSTFEDSSIFQILPLQKLGQTALILRGLMDKELKETKLNNFEQYQSKKLNAFIDRYNDPHFTPIDIVEEIRQNRKVLGMANNMKDLSRLLDLLVKLYKKDILIDQTFDFYQFPGSFSPFPHEGHIQIAKTIRKLYKGYIVIYTFANNEFKSDLNVSFAKRYELLKRAFYNVDNALVINLEGSTKSQISQMKRLNALSENKKIAYVLGSDVAFSIYNYLIKNSDSNLSREFWEEAPELFIIPRQKPPKEYKSAINYFESKGIKVTFIKKALINISGSILKAMDRTTLLNSMPNKFVKDAFIEYN